MKRITLLTAVVLIFQTNIVSTLAVAGSGLPQVRINRVITPLRPVLSGSRVYLPLQNTVRSVAPLLDSASSVTASAGSGLLVVQLGEHGVNQTINLSTGHVRFQEPQQGFDFRPLKLSGTTYIAAQDLVNLLAGKLSWNTSTRQLDLTFAPKPFEQVSLIGDLTSQRRKMVRATPRYRNGVVARNLSGNRAYLFPAGKADRYVLVDRANRYVQACRLIDTLSTCVWQAHLGTAAVDAGTEVQRYLGQIDKVRGSWDMWTDGTDAFEVSQSGAVLRVKSGTLDEQGQFQVKRSDSPSDPRDLIFPVDGL
jgi:hypothetical protein